MPMRHSTDKAQATKPNVEDKKRVNSQKHSIPHHTRATQDANASGQGPCDEDDVDWDTNDWPDVESTQ